MKKKKVEETKFETLYFFFLFHTNIHTHIQLNMISYNLKKKQMNFIKENQIENASLIKKKKTINS